MGYNEYNYQVHLETKRNYTLADIKSALEKFNISEETADRLTLDFDGWKLWIHLATGEDVETEANEIAGWHNKPVIAECNARLEIYAEDDPDEMHYNDHLYVIEAISELEGVHIYDQGMDEYLFEISEIKKVIDTSFLVPVEDNEDIMEELQGVLRDPGNWSSWHNLGVGYERAKMSDLSVQCYQRAVELNPVNALGYSNLGGVYKNTFNDLEKAMFNFRKAAEIEPANGEHITCLGRIFASMKEHDKALEYMLKGAELSPGNEFCNMTLGFYFLLYGNPDRALEFAEKAISQGEIHISSLNKGHVHLIRGEKETAIENYARSLRAFPTEANFWIDYDSDFEVMPQYGISLEYYNSLKGEIKAHVASLPALDLEEVVGFLRPNRRHRDAPPLTEAQEDYLRSLKIPETYIRWLKISNKAYALVIPGFPDNIELYLKNYEGLLDCIYEEGSFFAPISANGYLAFASDGQGNEYVFDTNEGGIRYLNYNGLTGIEYIYDDALESGELTPEEVYEDIQNKVYRVKSDYVRNYVHKNLTKKTCNSFEEFIGSYIEKLQAPQVKQPFKDLNFKLAVIGALHELGIYEQEAQALSEKHGDAEWSGVVAEVCEFYRTLEISPSQLALIETFSPVGSDACYRFALNDWEDETYIFNISSIQGIEQLENLTAFYPLGMIQSEGISYEPLLHCQKLERVNAEFMIPNDANYAVIEKLRACGVEVLNVPPYIATDFLKVVPGNDNLQNLRSRALGDESRSYLIWHNLGYHYDKANEIEIAFRCYENSLVLNPENHLAYFNMGKHYYGIRDYKQARKYYMKSLEINPEHSPSWESLGQVAGHENNRAEALTFLEKAVDVDPDNVLSHTNFAYYLIKFGDAERALFHAEKAFRHGSTYTSSFNMGHIFLVLGEIEKSVESYAISLRAADSEAAFWADYDADFSLLPQYGIAKEQYDALKPQIADKRKALPELKLNEIARLWENCAYLKGEMLHDEELDELRSHGVPEEYMEWLYVANRAYGTAELPHLDGYKGVRLKNYNQVMAEINDDDESEGLLFPNGYLVFADEYYVPDGGKAYAFDLADGSVRQLNEEVWISFYSVYSEHFKDALAAGELDLEEVYEDAATQEDYKPKSKYIRQFMEEKVFTGVRFDSFTDFLLSHVQALGMNHKKS